MLQAERVERKLKISQQVQNYIMEILTGSTLAAGLDNDQLDAHLLYFTISPLHSSTCFKH